MKKILPYVLGYLLLLIIPGWFDFNLKMNLFSNDEENIFIFLQNSYWLFSDQYMVYPLLSITGYGERMILSLALVLLLIGLGYFISKKMIQHRLFGIFVVTIPFIFTYFFPYRYTVLDQEEKEFRMYTYWFFQKNIPFNEVEDIYILDDSRPDYDFDETLSYQILAARDKDGKDYALGILHTSHNPEGYNSHSRKVKQYLTAVIKQDR